MITLFLNIVSYNFWLDNLCIPCNLAYFKSLAGFIWLESVGLNIYKLFCIDCADATNIGKG